MYLTHSNNKLCVVTDDNKCLSTRYLTDCKLLGFNGHPPMIMINPLYWDTVMDASNKECVTMISHTVMAGSLCTIHIAVLNLITLAIILLSHLKTEQGSSCKNA